MTPSRRDLALAAAAAALGDAASANAGPAARSVRPTYQLISQVTAAPGQRDALADIMVRGARGVPGCLTYVVAGDPDDVHALWVTELWADRESHEASLRHPQVRAAMAKGRPLMVGFLRRVETQPFAGFGASFWRPVA